MAKKKKRRSDRIELDWVQFKKLCGLQCTLVEIAGWFDCSKDTVRRRIKEKYDLNFEEIFKKFSASGKISLRRTQFRLAERNASMAIWLGKQYLGQREPKDFEDPNSKGWTDQKTIYGMPAKAI